MGHGSSHVCSSPDTSGPPIEPIVGQMTWHTVSIIIAGATGLFASLLALFNVMRHATHFSNPVEQVQIMRVLYIIPCFAIVNVLCAWLDGDASIYIRPALDISEAFPMAAFFLLENAYVVPNIHDRVAYFNSLENVTKKGQKQAGGSLAWYKKRNLFVLQFIPVSIILWIATAITQANGSYCITSSSPHFAKIWIQVIRVIATVMCIMSIVAFYGRLKSILSPRGTVKQLIAFKVIVFLNFIQTFVFSILAGNGDLKANKYMTYDDLANGLQSVILCCEMVLVATFMLFAFSAAPYTLNNHPNNAAQGRYYQGGPMGIKAIFKSLNLFSVIFDLLYIISGKGNSGGYREPMGPRGDGHYQGQYV